MDRPYRFGDAVLVCGLHAGGSVKHVERSVRTSVIAGRLNQGGSGDRWVDKSKIRDWPSLRMAPDGSSARDSKSTK